MNQTTLPLDGKTLRDIGINRSLKNANNHYERWSDRAYSFLQDYIQDHRVFMTEDVRIASKGVVEKPPSNRAWGGVVVRAVKDNLIKRIGFRNVKNTKAHCTPATLWGVI